MKRNESPKGNFRNNEIIFIVEDSPEGGYEAPIITLLSPHGSGYL